MGLLLPSFDARLQGGRTPTPQAQPVGQPGAMSLAGALDQVSSRMQDSYDAEAFTRAQGEFLDGMGEIESTLLKQNDFENATNTFEMNMAFHRRAVSEGLNQRVSRSFNAWADNQEREATARFTAANQKRYNAHTLAQFTGEQDRLANNIIYAVDPQSQREASVLAEMRFEAMKPFYADELQAANAYDAFQDRVLFGMEMQRLTSTDGYGWAPVPDLSAEKNQQLYFHAQALQAKAARNAEKAEANAEKAFKAGQDAYELEVLQKITRGDGYDLDDLQRDTRNQRLSSEGAKSIYRVLTGQGGPTNKDAYIDAHDVVLSYKRGDIDYETARQRLKDGYRNGGLNQQDYSSMLNDLDSENDRYTNDAKILLNEIYKPDQYDVMGKNKEAHARALREMQEIARGPGGGQAALAYAKEQAKKELDRVERPRGYTGEMKVPGLIQYRAQLVAQQEALLAEGGAKNDGEARKITGIISQIDSAIERINTLTGAAHE